MSEHPTKLAKADRASIAQVEAILAEMQDPALASHPSPMVRPQAGFQFPHAIWMGMIACYALFMIAVAVVTGSSGHAVFAIAISLLYIVIFFGLVRIMARQAGPEAPSPLQRGQDLQTWCGPMSGGSVYGQVLIVPAAIAGFGVAIAIIVAVVT